MNEAHADSPRAADEPQSSAQTDHDEILARLGQMTRNLHDSLRGLGFDKLIEKAAHDIPDARDRLDYVAKMTEQAAQRVLNAIDAASPLQQEIDSGATALASNWRSLLEGAAPEAGYREMAERTLAYLDATKSSASVTRQHLLDIMMAQDFQDLTGQVIKKVTELAHGIEQQLVQLLVDHAPAEVRRQVDSGLLNGPQIKPTSNPDAIANQTQVDELLESLGF